MKTASGATAVQIAVRENRWDKVLEHLGPAHIDAELAALMQVGRDKIHAGQRALDLGMDQDSERPMVNAKVSRILVGTLRAAWPDLGSDVVDGGQVPGSGVAILR